jgi:hypothetical protein
MQAKLESLLSLPNPRPEVLNNIALCRILLGQHAEIKYKTPCSAYNLAVLAFNDGNYTQTVSLLQEYQTGLSSLLLKSCVLLIEALCLLGELNYAKDIVLRLEAQIEQRSHLGTPLYVLDAVQRSRRRVLLIGDDTTDAGLCILAWKEIDLYRKIKYLEMCRDLPTVLFNKGLLNASWGSFAVALAFFQQAEQKHAPKRLKLRIKHQIAHCLKLLY